MVVVHWWKQDGPFKQLNCYEWTNYQNKYNFLIVGDEYDFREVAES